MTTWYRGMMFATVCAMFTSVAWAQSYPNKPVRWTVTGGAGGAYDIFARALMPIMGNAVGQPMIVENRAGSSGIAGTEFVVRSAPDGYNLLFTGNTQLAQVKFTHANLPYDPQRDVAPITMLGFLPSVLFVHSSVQANSLKELIALAKANPGKLNYASAGIGHSFHLGTELLKQRTGMDITHIPFKTTPGALQDLFAGRIEIMFYPPTGQLLAQIKEGKVRPIASSTERRFPRLPDVPTFLELGVSNFEVPGWMALAAPAGTPRDITLRWNGEAAKAMAAPEMAKIVEQLAMVPALGTPEQLARKISADLDLWGPVVKAVGIKPE